MVKVQKLCSKHPSRKTILFKQKYKRKTKQNNIFFKRPGGSDPAPSAINATVDPGGACVTSRKETVTW